MTLDQLIVPRDRPPGRVQYQGADVSLLGRSGAPRRTSARSRATDSLKLNGLVRWSSAQDQSVGLITAI